MTELRTQAVFASVVLAMLVLPVAYVSAQRSSSPSVSEMKSVDRKHFVSDASHIVATYQVEGVQQETSAMVEAANAFLKSLSDELRERANLKLKDAERRNWTNLPAPRDAGGVRLGDLKPEQVKLVCRLLATMFSDQGYRKMRDIMLADDQLLRNGRARPGFGTENFSVVIFGNPSASEAWAFQIDGHHVGVNLAIKGQDITMSPSFIGTQPHKFEIEKHVFLPFQKETNLAYRLLNSLNDDQIKAAVQSEKRGRIVTGPGNDGKTPNAQGLKCDQLDEKQRKVLTRLIQQWVYDLPERKAKARMKEIKNEIEQMTLSWNGGKEKGSDISYRIQSPSLIIEYACQDLGGNPIDHLHSMYRNPKNEYGGQLK